MRELQHRPCRPLTRINLNYSNNRVKPGHLQILNSSPASHWCEGADNITPSGSAKRRFAAMLTASPEAAYPAGYPPAVNAAGA